MPSWLTFGWKPDGQIRCAYHALMSVDSESEVTIFCNLDGDGVISVVESTQGDLSPPIGYGTDWFEMSCEAVGPLLWLNHQNSLKWANWHAPCF